MTMPGLTAESSLYRSSRRYRQSQYEYMRQTTPMAMVQQIRFRPGPVGGLLDDFGGGPIDFEPVEPPVSFASITVECANGKNYNLSTGNKKGSCWVHLEGDETDNGKVDGATCTDKKGNNAFVSCNDGCHSAQGSGSCELMTKAA
jgi:hypothetical protein